MLQLAVTPDHILVVTTTADSVDGDTNKNGAATLPAPGDWTGVVINGTATANVLRDVVIRYAGGHNAGHTVVVGEQQFILHILPSGVLHPGVINVITKKPTAEYEAEGQLEEGADDGP